MQAMRRFEICTQESVRKTIVEVCRMSSYIYSINTNGHMLFFSCLLSISLPDCLPQKLISTSSCDGRLQRPFFEVDKMVGEEGEQLDNKARRRTSRRPNDALSRIIIINVGRIPIRIGLENLNFSLEGKLELQWN